MPTVIDTKQDLQHAILQQLSRGHQNAITKDLLRQRLALRNDREMRQEIKELRHTGHLIGLSVKKPYGYYLIETAEELAGCMATLKGYCVEAAIARRDLKVAGRKLLEQQYLTDSGQQRLF